MRVSLALTARISDERTLRERFWQQGMYIKSERVSRLTWLAGCERLRSSALSRRQLRTSHGCTASLGGTLHKTYPTLTTLYTAATLHSHPFHSLVAKIDSPDNCSFTLCSFRSLSVSLLHAFFIVLSLSILFFLSASFLSIFLSLSLSFFFPRVLFISCFSLDC